MVAPAPSLDDGPDGTSSRLIRLVHKGQEEDALGSTQSLILIGLAVIDPAVAAACDLSATITSRNEGGSRVVPLHFRNHRWRLRGTFVENATFVVS